MELTLFLSEAKILTSFLESASSRSVGAMLRAVAVRSRDLERRLEALVTSSQLPDLCRKQSQLWLADCASFNAALLTDRPAGK